MIIKLIAIKYVYEARVYYFSRKIRQTNVTVHCYENYVFCDKNANSFKRLLRYLFQNGNQAMRRTLKYFFK